MESQLRLAERRGRFTTDQCSPVQTLGLQMFMVVEGMDHSAETRRELALALVGGQWTQNPAELFPILRGERTEEEEAEELLDDPSVDDAKPTGQEMAEIERLMAEAETGFFTGDPEGGRGEWH